MILLGFFPLLLKVLEVLKEKQRPFSHLPCTLQDLHHKDCFHLGDPLHCVANEITSKINFAVAAYCPHLPQVVCLGTHRGVSVSYLRSIIGILSQVSL